MSFLDSPVCDLYDYVPPKRELKPFTCRVEAIDEVRLQYWIDENGKKKDILSRGKAIRHALREFLDAQGVPNNEELLRRHFDNVRYQQKAG